MNFLLDENFPSAALTNLQQAGHAADHALDMFAPGINDDRPKQNPLGGRSLSDRSRRDAAPGPSTPSHDVANRKHGTQIATTIQSMPEDQRTAIVLAENHGLPQPEIVANMVFLVKSV